MKVNIKCFAGLNGRYGCSHHKKTELEIPDGTTVKELLAKNRIPEDEVKIYFVNGIIANKNQQLLNGDNLALAPATGGM